MTRDMFKEWTLRKIEENPKLYGGDKGNPAIIHAYLTELHGNTKASDLTYEAISQSVGVSRDRNKILEQRPEYDFRVVHKPKSKKHYIKDDEVA